MGVTVLDESNNPSVVKIGVKGNNAMVQLPRDVIITINGKKIIAESKILDGVTVFERIARAPYEISFDFTVREYSLQQNIDATINDITKKKGEYVFPQSVLQNLIKNIWEPNSILDIENTLLNNVFGIFEIVVEEIPDIATVQGSKNVPMKLSCKENYDSQDVYANTLILA